MNMHLRSAKSKLLYIFMALLIFASVIPLTAMAATSVDHTPQAVALSELPNGSSSGLKNKVKDSLELSRLYYLSNPPTFEKLEDEPDRPAGSYADFWTLLAMWGAGIDLTDSQIWTDGTPWDDHTYWQIGKASLRDGREYAGSIIGSYLLGLDVRKFGTGDLQQDLIRTVVDKQADNGSFFTDYLQHAWTVMALDIADADYDREAAVQYILDQQNASGTFPWGMDGTGWALAVLAPYQDQPEVRKAMDRIVEYFHSRLGDNGEIGGQMEGRNANSLAVAIFGLNAAGENLLSDKWTRNGNNLIEVFVDRYQTDDGGFKWLESDTEANGMATYQAVIAIGDVVAGRSIYQRLYDSVHDSSASIEVDLRVEGSADVIFHGPVTMTAADAEATITVYDVLQQALPQQNIAIDYGDYEGSYYIASINGEEQAQYGAYDGWLYMVNGQSPWDGINKYVLSDQDEIYIYYGNSSEIYEGSGVAERVDQLTLLPQIKLNPVQPVADQAIEVKVTADYNIYTETWDMKSATSAIEGALVHLNGQSYLTNKEGIATIPADQVTEGTYQLKVSKDVEGSFPRLVRQLLTVTIVGESQVAQLPYLDASSISEWALGQVVIGEELGWFSEIAGKLFLPQQSLNRAELATLLYNMSASSLATQGSSDMVTDGKVVKFVDVPAGSVHVKAIEQMVARGWMIGTGEHTFSPEQSVTREQLAVVIGRILQLNEVVTNEMYEVITDIAFASPWAQDWIVRVYNAQVLLGDGLQFNPKQLVTREMAVVVMVRMLDQLK